MKVQPKKIELYILIAMLVFCSVYVSKTTMDFTITVRNLVWCAGTIILCVLIALRAMEGQVDLSIIKRLVFPIFCGLILVSVLSIFKAANRGEAKYETVRVVAMAAFLLCATVIIRENNKDVLIKSIVLLAVALACYGIYQYFTIKVNPAKRIGTMANMNLCSSAHLLLMPFSVYAIIRYSKLWKILGTVSVLIALFIILFSLRTRSTWVALFVMAIVGTLRRKKIAVFMVIAFIILGATLYMVKGATILNTDSMKQRADMWGQSLNMFNDNPLGVGAGNWRVAIPFYSRNMSETTRAVAFKTIYFQRPHNDWVWVLTELGAIGFILYLSLFVLSFYYSIKARSVLLYSCLAAYVVCAFFSFPKERTFHTMYILLAMALAISLYHKSRPLILNRRPAYLGSILVLACLSFSMCIFYARYTTEKKMFHALHARKAGDWKAVHDYTKDISPYSTLDSFGTPILYYQGISKFIRKDYGCALEDFQGALKESPNQIYVLMNLASTLTVHNKLDAAQKCYKRVIELYPDHTDAINNLKAVKAVAMKGKSK